MGEIDVLIPGPVDHLNFTPPSSPAHIDDYYFSAPPSPSKLLHFYKDFDQLSDARRNSVSLSVPFEWEEIPGKPKSVTTNYQDYDFAFDVSQEIDTPSLSADQLFDGGKIRPLKPSSAHISLESQRGRETSVSSLSSSSSRSGHRATRSLSPLRVSEYPWEEEYRRQQQNRQNNSKQLSSKPNLTTSASALSSSSLKAHKKWKLRDFFLFRSASEGRATDKRDPLKKYASLFKKQEDPKSSSFRSIDSPGTNSGSNSRKKGRASAHELHYTTNRAVSEDLKKKTFLPYKQGILGRLAFNPAVHAIANGFGFSHK